ncbi:unnamed protein product [Urochloa decumbens]|uniref:F-box domain-containing protein n=1 Tax=Urochloa decumbens TaxID=240449 RepID=A0ABC9C4J5_9POAL
MAASTDQAERLNDDVVVEILLRLPPAAVLRFGAVCRAWRRITASPAFLAAHARRRPLELIIKGPGCALSTIPLATLGDDVDTMRRRRRLRLRWCGPGGGDYLGGLLGAYDGLLLFERHSGCDHLVCNPVTRQWALLPRTPSLWIRVCGVYVHAPSGEHRLLYLANDEGNVPGGTWTATHRVLSLGGAAVARRIGPPAAAIEIYSQMPGAYLSHRGNLHWVRHPWVVDTDKILAFDPVAETFRLIPRPPTRDQEREWVSLVKAHGSLAVTAILHGSMDLWVLEDYDSDDSSSWTHRLRVDLPSPLESAKRAVSVHVLGQNVILLENEHHVVALYSLTEKKVLKQVELGRDIENYSTRSTSFLFRDSLERHAFFDLQGTTS